MGCFSRLRGLGEWVECMGATSGCGEQEADVASGSGWNLCVWLLDVVVRRYIDFLILIIPTLLVYRIAGNIGGNYIWRIARKSLKIEIGGS